MSSTNQPRNPKLNALALRAVVLIDAEVRLRMQADPAAYERFVREEVDDLDRQYRSGTSPKTIALAATALHAAVAGIADWPSPEHARLRGLIGQMLVAAGGGVDVMAEAEVHLVAAIEELCTVSDWTRQRRKLLAELVLNHAVSLKARGQVPEAADLLRKTMVDPALAPYWGRGDVLPLFRQDVIMAGGVGPHRHLAEQHDAMRAAGLLEHYRTVKRVFEFAMNAGATAASARLLPASIKAFAPIAARVPPLARISLIKNVGQYEALAGRTDRAVKLLTVARLAAEEQVLRGQLRQIDHMITLIEAGERPLLQTYVAS